MSDLRMDSLGGDAILAGAHVPLPAEKVRAAVAFVRAHDPDPDDLLEALGLGGASDAA